MKEIFFTIVWEPLRRTLVFLDFTTNNIDQVIDRVLDMDQAQNCNTMMMGTLQRALSKEEELRFWQVVQFTTCLNPDHSTLECTIRMHNALYHSRAHTID